jgi:hypothetical protein
MDDGGMSWQGVVPPVVISPFANERVREWPIAHYRRFIERVLCEHRVPVAIVGTRAQRVRADELVRGFSYPEVVNTAGRLSWRQLVRLIDAAPYVVANNSGIAHLAAVRGCWTLCLFSGSHSWVEWMPRGPRVVVITRVTSCAPCALGGGRCPHRTACMTDLAPDAAFELFDERRASCHRDGAAREFVTPPAGGASLAAGSAEALPGAGLPPPSTAFPPGEVTMSRHSPAFERRFTIRAAELSRPEAYRPRGEDAPPSGAVIEFDARHQQETDEEVLFYGPYISLDPGIYLFTPEGELDGKLQIRFTHQGGELIKELAIDSFGPLVLAVTRKLDAFEVVGMRTPELRSLRLQSIAVHHIDPSRN